METITAKQDRIGARVPHDVYETLCRSAELSGATINQFLVQSALKEAEAVIERLSVNKLFDCQHVIGTGCSIYLKTNPRRMLN